MDLLEKDQILPFLLHQNHFDKTLNLKRNEYLKSTNSIDTNIYFIEEGTFKIFFHDQDEERIVRFGYPGNIIVSLDSYISEKPSALEIKALKKSKVRVLGKTQFLEIIKSYPKFLESWNLILQDLVLQQMEREIDLLIQSPKIRYERVLKRSPQLFQEISNNQIANYLRMSPETLSRLKKT